jgi:membrane protein
MFPLIFVLGKRTATGYAKDNCGQQAAAMAYYVLFSIVPLAIFLISIAGVFFGTDENIGRIIDAIEDIVPGDIALDTQGRDTIKNALQSFQSLSGIAAITSLLASGWASTAMFASVRRSLNVIWGTFEERPWAIAKLVDIAQIGLIAAVLVASVVLTGLVRVVRDFGVQNIGFMGDSLVWEIPGVLIPLFLAFATFVALYHVVPTRRPPWRPVIIGAGVAAVLFQSLLLGFAFYVTNFNNFNVVYGSLAGVFLFLFFVYFSANTLLIGAQVVRTFELYEKGALDAELQRRSSAEGGMDVTPSSVADMAKRAVKGLFVKDPASRSGP